jgi:peptidoglycan glycosyltransferase
MDTESKRIIRILIVLCTLFISLVLYLNYFQIFKASKIQKNSYNKRQWINEEYVLRGTIADRNGKALAYSDKIEDHQVRHYPFGNLYSHIIGYSYKEYGKSGLESSYNEELLDLHKGDPIHEIKEKITGPRKNGNNLILTIDHDLQSYAEQQLQGKKGSIVLMNPKNGEIYAMVSKPDFDPSTLREKWRELAEEETSPLLNRSTMGLYAPGSTFKVITATAALEDESVKKTFQCKGSVNIGGYQLNDYGGKAHGKINLEGALVHSCNVAFSQMGLELGQEKLKDIAEKYRMNQIIPFDLKTKNSIFPKKGTMSKPELGASAIGQGKLLMTPLNMALVASSIANDGVMMKPILVKEVISKEGEIVKVNNARILGHTSDVSIAQEVKNMMTKVVEKGTGRNARIRNVRVAGKTGTAENETGKEHAWFIGFAPADNPEVAIAIVLENMGSTGGKSAAPIARNIMTVTLKKLGIIS